MDQRKPVLPGYPAFRRAGRQQGGVEPRVKEQQWPGTVMALSVFVALFTLLWLGRRTFVDLLTLLRVLVVCCVAGNLLPYAWSGLRLGMEKFEWFFFNLLSIGPITVCLLLVVNHYIHGPVQWTEGQMGGAVAIVIQPEQSGDGEERDEFVTTTVRYDLPYDFFTFTDEEHALAVNGRFRVGVARGCLGYWSITDVEPVR